MKSKNCLIDNGLNTTAAWQNCSVDHFLEQVSNTLDF